MKRLEKIPIWVYVCISFAIILLTAFIEYEMGRLWICKCGEIKLWEGVVQSSGNSQHIADWYTISHITHGFIFYWFFRIVSKKRLSVIQCLVLSIFVESAWEIFENTNFIINRYREATISLDYYGDSILNSIADIFWMIGGFFLAWRLPVWLSVTLIIVFEIWMGYMIRDNLILNAVMLIYPLEFIKDWQLNS